MSFTLYIKKKEKSVFQEDHLLEQGERNAVKVIIEELLTK